MNLQRVGTAIGTILMVLSAVALLLAIRNFTQAIRTAGASGAYNSPPVVFYGVFALATLLIAAGLLRGPLRRRAPRLLFAAATVVVVVAGICAGYFG